MVEMERSSSMELDASEETPSPDEVSCNLENVYICLKNGTISNDDVDLRKYIEGYKELYNFFILLGKAFNFVASDVKTKIKILQDLLDGQNGKNFTTVKSMMEYEMDSKLLKDSKYVSGSRTLLRLHRGLDFVRKFLAEVYKLDNGDGIGGVCRNSYDLTLGNFHPWIIRKAATLAMKLLPSKASLLNKITKNDPVVLKRTVEIMPEMLTMMGTVYDRVEALYTKFDLHSLP